MIAVAMVFAGFVLGHPAGPNARAWTVGRPTCFGGLVR